VWTRSSNLYGWSAYLGHRAGEPEPRQYAVPARRRSLQGLPAAWIGVGDADLFYAECVQYAQRLKEARVPCEVQVVPGAFHGFDMVGRETQVAQAFRAAYLQAMRSVLSV
jgi:acetyl esterase/lipase